MQDSEFNSPITALWTDNLEFTRGACAVLLKLLPLGNVNRPSDKKAFQFLFLQSQIERFNILQLKKP